MEISEEEKVKTTEYLSTLAKDMLCDKNRLAKAVAYYVRNGIENFHAEYLSDEQMKELNPLIRNAIYTFLVDFKQELNEIASDENIGRCAGYVLNIIHPFLLKGGIDHPQINEFDNAVTQSIDISLYDMSKGGLMLAGYGLIVPKYWEDCVYVYK